MSKPPRFDVALLEELSHKAEQLYIHFQDKQKRIQVSNLRNTFSANRAVAKKAFHDKIVLYTRSGASYNRPFVNHDHNTRVHKIKKESVVNNYRKTTKLPEVAKLPPARLYNYTPFNIHVEDQKALDHIPYFDDETATEGNEFIQNIIEIHDGNIHSAMVIEEDTFFVKLVRQLDKIARSRYDPRQSSPIKSKRLTTNPTDGICEVVFQAIAHAFPSEGSPDDVQSRFIKLITSKPPCFNPNIDGVHAMSVDRCKALHSFKSLFCRRCLIYDCHLHTKEQDLSPEKLSNIVIRNRDNFIEHTPLPLDPCSDTCYMHLAKKPSNYPQPATSAITNAMESIIRCEWSSSPANFCLLNIFLCHPSVTCAMVYSWCKKNIADFHIFMDLSGEKCISARGKNGLNGALRPSESMSFDDDSNNSGNSATSEDACVVPSITSGNTNESKMNRSNRSKRKTFSNGRSSGRNKKKLRNPFHKINQLKSKLSGNCVHNYSPCVDHIGEECTNECECIINGHGCEKFCLCSSKCQFRLPGCLCNGNCNTGQCPCFKASRECDPDLCKSCGAGDFPEPKKCCNVAIQRKKKKHLLIAPSGLGHEAGWGCYTKNKVFKNELISEYCGELISQVEADRRGIIYDKYKISYLFQLNSQFAVDATIKGNKIRFANHSVTPNCYAKIISVIGEHRIGIFAARDIDEGEELFFDYKYGNNERLIFVPIEQHVAVNGKDVHTPKTPANCAYENALQSSNNRNAVTVRNYAIKSASRVNQAKRLRKIVF